MPEIKLNARIQNKYKPLKDWDKILKGQFTPLKGELCYGVENNILYQKIGDGITDFVDLPWLINQSDFNENNIDSPAYIKNRMAYPEYIQINKTLVETKYIAQELIENQLILPKDILISIGQEFGLGNINYFENTNNFIIALPPEETIYFNNISDILNKYNKLSFNLQGKDEENILSIPYDKDNKILGTTNYKGIEVSCLGNTKWAKFLFTLVTSEFIDFTEDKNLEEKYCILNIGPIELEENAAEMGSFLLIDSDAYKPNIDESTYNYSLDLKLNAIGSMHTIDQEYLGDIQSDLAELDSSKLSYVKNKIGEIATLTLAESNNYSSYKSLVKLGLKKMAGFYEINEETIETYYEHNLDKLTVSCDVSINEDVYINCRLYKLAHPLSINDKYGVSSIYYLGNPKYFSEYLKYYYENEYADNIEYTIQITDLENNNLPFFFAIDFNSGTPLKTGNIIYIEKQSEYKTISLEIKPKTLRTSINPIDSNYLENQSVVGQYNKNYNSILFNSSYIASGVNSIGAGQETQAKGNNSLALGNKTQALGNNSISFGENSIAKGYNSIAGGKDTYAEENCIALGEGSVAAGTNNVVVGLIETSTIISAETRNDQYSANIRLNSCPYNQYSIDNINWYDLVYEFDNDICVLKFSDPIDTYITTFYLRRISKLEGTNSIGLGTGLVSRHNNNFMLGQNLTTGNNNQTILGKNNKINEDALFIIGSGKDIQSPENSFWIDKNYDINLNGNLIFNSEKIKFQDNSININSILENQLLIQLQSDKIENYDNQSIVIYNNNLWPVQFWNESQTDEEGNEFKTYPNGSLIKFYKDGSIYLDYKAGDNISFTRASNSSTLTYLPKGQYIISNGLNENLPIFLYLDDISRYNTNNSNHPGLSEVCSIGHARPNMGIRCESTDYDFEITLYPQIKPVNQNGYSIPKKEIIYFDSEGIINLDLKKYRSWSEPVLVLNTNNKDYNIIAEGIDISKISIMPKLKHNFKKEKKYIFKFFNNQNLNNLSYNPDNQTFKLEIDLGYKNEDQWISNYTNISTEILELSELFYNDLLNSNLKGYELYEGYLINHTNQWSVNINKLANTFKNYTNIENGKLQIKKVFNETDELLHCKIVYEIKCDEINSEIENIINSLITAEEFICHLPEGVEIVAVN